MRKFVDQFEKVAGSSPLVLSSHVEKQYGPSGDTVYLKGSLQFIDSSVLEFAVFAAASPEITIDKYRYQYMKKDGRLIFRYDNAPHHPEVSSFPHHKHTSDKVAVSSMPVIKDILNEISTLILQGRL